MQAIEIREPGAPEVLQLCDRPLPAAGTGEVRVRVHAACRLLAGSDQAITGIALDTGFYDHSHFTRTFRRLMGLTPRAYRATHQDR